MMRDHDDCWLKQLRPGLEKSGFRFLRVAQLDEADRKWIEKYYASEVRPVLTPLAVDPAHPFPQLLNRSLNLVVKVATRSGKKSQLRLAVVQVPRVLPRLVRLPRADGRMNYVFLGQLIGHFLGDLFAGTRIWATGAFG
jgi:polyphosphate kinase